MVLSLPQQGQLRPLWGEAGKKNRALKEGLFLCKRRVHAQGHCLAGVLVPPSLLMLELSAQSSGLSQVDTRSSLDLTAFDK